MHRKWMVLAAVSLIFFFISGTTFSSLGIALYWMKQELGWTQTEAGTSFSVLGLACCLSSLLPMVLVNRFGSRWTYFTGGLTLAAGFALAWAMQSFAMFLVATALIGVGFTLTANIPGVYLLARWFPGQSGRIIGAYLMIGAAGGVVGPPLAQFIIAHADWRTLWLVLAMAAVVLAVVCLAMIRDEASDPVDADDKPAPDVVSEAWTYSSAALTPQFAILALAMVITETCVTVLHSAGVMHFAQAGLPPEFAALMLSLQAVMATGAKGLSGWLGDTIDPRKLLVGGLAFQGIGMLLLGMPDGRGMAYAFAVTFGLGWGTAYLTITVLLIRYFGARVGSAVLSLVWLMVTLSSLGPAGAGWVADHFHTFSPVFIASGIVLMPIALAVLMMKKPVARRAVPYPSAGVQPAATFAQGSPL